MEKLEALENLEIIKQCFIDTKMGNQYINAINTAIDCVQQCIDNDNDSCYNCNDKHCDNCLYSGRIPE